MKEDKKLSTLFPEEIVYAQDSAGVKVPVTTVSPIPIQNLTLIFDAFSKLVSLAALGRSEQAIAIEAVKEILEIMPFCIDRPVAEIPSAFAPDIIKIMINQNLTEEVVGKWTALAEQIAKEVSGSVKETKGAAS